MGSGSFALLPQGRRKALGPGWWKEALLALAVGATAYGSLAGVVGPQAETFRSLSVSPSDTPKAVQRKNKKLRAKLSKSPWPELTCFEAQGRVYPLPLRAGSRNSATSHWHDISITSRLRYLAGFFDGDGSVSCSGRLLSGCSLRIGQSYDQAAILMRFWETFAGSITLQCGGMGLQKPLLRWTVTGQNARIAAQMLAPHGMVRRRQLLLAAQWPDTPSERERCAAELRALKEYDSADPGPCSWEYCAGFFDAEGCITQAPAGASLALRIRRRHPKVLRSLRDFLAGTLGTDATLKPSTSGSTSSYVLWIYEPLDCRQVLQHMLRAGLLCKARQSMLFLRLTPENAARICAKLALEARTGNRQFGKKRDASDRERARNIASAQAQAAELKRRGQYAKAGAKQHEAAILKHADELVKARRENQQLFEYLSKLHDLHDSSWHGPLAPGL
ncbi:unnamed protein product [Symbiodinium sp. CCMP2456]|nr:unnamed protein product [Symbiodinium sp. CCMP2456]